MRHFNDLSLRIKLLGMAGVLLALALAIGVLGITGLSMVASSSRAGFIGDTKPLAALGAAQAKFNENRALAYIHLLASDDAKRAQTRATVLANRKVVEARLATVAPQIAAEFGVSRPTIYRHLAKTPAGASGA